MSDSSSPAGPTDYPGFARRRLATRRPALQTGGAAPARRAAVKNRQRPLDAVHQRRARYPTQDRPLDPLTPADDPPRHSAASPARSHPAPNPFPRWRPPAEAPESDSPGDPGASAVLHDELARLKTRQTRHRHRLVRRPRTRRGMVALAVPVIFLTAIAAVIGPVVYRGTRAYQQVFVPTPPREEQPFVAVRNEAGTPVPVLATSAPEIPAWDETERMTMLLLGVDRREDEPSRSDTMILVNIDPVTKTAGLLSIPRDLRVIIPGYGVHKINAAYAFGESDERPGGGPGLVIRTIETNFGIRIDHFAEVDFDGFIKIVDTVGGVTLDVPYPIKDNAYPASGTNYMRIYFPAGWQHLDGVRALQYARTRHDDGDANRSRRQQQVLLALREQAVSFDLLPKAGELLGELSDAVRTDLGPTRAIKLAGLATEFSSDSIVSYSLDPALTEDNTEDGYYLDADWDIVGGILSDFAGVEITPPRSALANPRLDIPIRIENGSLNPGLGDRVAAILAGNGFTNIAVVDRIDAGQYPASSIASNSDDLAAALLIAGIAGIDPSVVAIRDGAPADAAADSADRDGIVVILGDDAPDPAYFVADPVPDESAPIEQGGE